MGIMAFTIIAVLFSNVIVTVTGNALSVMVY